MEEINEDLLNEDYGNYDPQELSNLIEFYSNKETELKEKAKNITKNQILWRDKVIRDNSAWIKGKCRIETFDLDNKKLEVKGGCKRNEQVFSAFYKASDYHNQAKPFKKLVKEYADQVEIIGQLLPILTEAQVEVSQTHSRGYTDAQRILAEAGETVGSVVRRSKANAEAVRTQAQVEAIQKLEKSKTDNIIKRNRNTIMIVGIVIFVVVIAYFLYKKYKK